MANLKRLKAQRKRRVRRVRRRVRSVLGEARPRLSVHRSLNHIYAQVIDDAAGRTVAAASTLEDDLRAGKTGNCDAAAEVGRRIGGKAKEAGAYIVATGRGDFPNQVNNSVGFPAVIKGALIVRARKITDNMAIAAAHSIAYSAEKRGINPDYIMPTMDEPFVFPREATAVAMQAIEDKVNRIELSEQEIYQRADHDIKESRELFHHLMNEGFIRKPPISMIEESLDIAIQELS